MVFSPITSSVTSPSILNLGSLNIDYFYSLAHFVQPGETLTSAQFMCRAGGKGNNQSYALARAGASVEHIGKIGKEGLFLRDLLAQEGVNVTQVDVVAAPTGHAIIQISPEGENAIILYPGANYGFLPQEIPTFFANKPANSVLVLQNEINCLEVILEKALACQFTIFFNPAPFTPEVKNYPLSQIYCLILNFIEGQQLTQQSEPLSVFQMLKRLYPHTHILLTLGQEGVLCYWEGQDYWQKSIATQVIDTTGAGDTFIGYFVAALIHHGLPIETCLHIAATAASLSIRKPGAAEAIPYWNEVFSYTKK